MVFMCCSLCAVLRSPLKPLGGSEPLGGQSNNEREPETPSGKEAQVLQFVDADTGDQSELSFVSANGSPRQRPTFDAIKRAIKDQKLKRLEAERLQGEERQQRIKELAEKRSKEYWEAKRLEEEEDRRIYETGEQRRKAQREEQERVAKDKRTDTLLLHSLLDSARRKIQEKSQKSLFLGDERDSSREKQPVDAERPQLEHSLKPGEDKSLPSQASKGLDTDQNKSPHRPAKEHGQERSSPGQIQQPSPKLEDEPDSSREKQPVDAERPQLEHSLKPGEDKSLPSQASKGLDTDQNKSPHRPAKEHGQERSSPGQIQQPSPKLRGDNTSARGDLQIFDSVPQGKQQPSPRKRSPPPRKRQAAVTSKMAPDTNKAKTDAPADVSATSPKRKVLPRVSSNTMQRTVSVEKPKKRQLVHLAAFKEVAKSKFQSVLDAFVFFDHMKVNYVSTMNLKRGLLKLDADDLVNDFDALVRDFEWKCVDHGKVHCSEFIHLLQWHEIHDLNKELSTARLGP